MAQARIRSGKFRHRITIEESTSAAGTYGGESITWSTHSNPYADIESMIGREFLGSGKISGDTTHKFWFRVNKDKADLTRDMRISYGGKNYVMTSPPIQADERDRMWIVLAKVHD